MTGHSQNNNRLDFAGALEHDPELDSKFDGEQCW